MAELTSILVAKRERENEERKFLAAIQGIDIDKNVKSTDGKERGQKEWEDLKARVFTGGKTKDSNDVASLRGINAQQAGFGIGFGLDYASVSDKDIKKNPLRP
jgi:hypothetical protein